MSPLNSTEHGDPHRARTNLGSFAIGLVHGMGGSAGVGILLVASIESQLLGVISLGALAIFTGRSMTILSTGFGAALASRPLRSSLTAVAPGLGVASFAFAIWYGAAAWTLAPIRSERSSCTAREALEPVRHAHDLPEDHAVRVFVAHPAVKAR